jgi:23S rRNA G2069 N7-methylase RlmK/C1962 C5-methylase RlmI
MSESESRIAEQAEMFGNRLRKNAKHRRKWAKRSNVSCYRLYDRDIPEVPLVVDWYEGRLHIAEFIRQDDDEAGLEARLRALATSAATVMEVDPEQVYVKQRRRQRGSDQYQRLSRSRSEFEVREGGHRFIVNLEDYTDTGLFLDHRQTREMVAAACTDKSFLNLFAYTGAFTVYAAAAGAALTTTVDLSNGYLDWARRNLALNGIDPENHCWERVDVLAWLATEKRSGRLYDVVFLDPPTFSNSKKMDSSLDTLRDHAGLVEATMDLLAPGGEIWFSTNARRFQLDPRLQDRANITEMTEQTVPPDFSRRPHRCWRMETS